MEASARRAMPEHARPVLIAATSEISAIITADGAVLAQSRQFTQAIFVRQIQASTALTPAGRLGELPEWVLAGAGTCAAALLPAGMVGIAIRGKTRRRQGT